MGNQNSGRRPMPSALKVLRGNPGCRKLNDREPMPAGGPVEKPGYLSPVAAVIWDELAPGCLGMGTLTSVDVPAFVGLCELEATARRASQGKEYPTWNGQREERESRIALARFYDFFGMTPSGRSRIKVPKSTEPKSKWEAVRA